MIFYLNRISGSSKYYERYSVSILLASYCQTLNLELGSEAEIPSVGVLPLAKYVLVIVLGMWVHTKLYSSFSRVGSRWTQILRPNEICHSTHAL
jgi:hypothetical protein